MSINGYSKTYFSYGGYPYSRQGFALYMLGGIIYGSGAWGSGLGYSSSAVHEVCVSIHPGLSHKNVGFVEKNLSVNFHQLHNGSVLNCYSNRWNYGFIGSARSDEMHARDFSGDPA